MTLTSLFSFDGRMRRSHFWLIRLGALFAVFGVFMVMLMLGSLVGALTGTGSPSPGQTAPAPAAASSGPMLAFSLLSLVCMLATLVAYVWVELAILVKRWHDRDRPGVMVLVLFIPFIGGIWTLIECGFLDGTPGPNIYGPSPKLENQAATFV